jgi:muconolactone delta-isomerase
MTRTPIIRLGYPWWLRLLLWRDVAAITLGRRIYVAPGIAGEALERLLRHEQIHVEQMARLGIVRFLWRYVREYAANRMRGFSAAEAYRRISFEVEAFAAEEGKPV